MLSSSTFLLLRVATGAAGIVFTLLISSSHAFQVANSHHRWIHYLHRQLAAKSEDYHQDDEDAVPDIDTDDWRAFRAQLVAGNSSSSSSGDSHFCQSFSSMVRSSISQSYASSGIGSRE